MTVAVRAYVACLAVACAPSWPATLAAVFGVGDDSGAKVTKCCPRDAILKIDMGSCTEYVPGDQDSRDSYAWSSTDDESAPVDLATFSSHTPVDDVKLSLANRSSIPWWIPYEMEFLRASNLSEKFEPEFTWFDADGRMIPCVPEEREVSILDDDVAVLDDGRLIMLDQENGTFDGVHERTTTFSSDEYCIDRVSLVDNITFTNTQRRHNERDVPATTMATPDMPTYSYVALVCRPCSRIMCVPKCCSKGFMLEYRKNRIVGCKRSPSVAVTNAAIHLKAANGTVLKPDKDFFFFRMQPPDCGIRNTYMLNDSHGYWLLPDGRMAVDQGLVPIEPIDYCVDAMNGTPDGTSASYSSALLACRLDAAAAAAAAAADGNGTRGTLSDADGPLEFREILYGSYFVVGTTFLAATLLIYAVLPELRVTVHSGNLIAHTMCLFVSYAALAATTLVRRAFNRCACVFAGFLIQFSFLAAFFWLNVMCADIAWTFSGFRLLLYSNKIENEKKKYIIYSVYAWGSSITITILTALAEFTQIFGDQLNIKPNFGLNAAGCWFSNKRSVGVFFYLPIGLLLFTNFILFLFTAFRIVFIRRNTSKVLNRHSNQNNMRLSLYLKLFCLMGVTFVFELISWAVEAPPYYWYVTDAVNSLRGVFVFFIFCWKRSVLNLLLARAPEQARHRFVRTFGVPEPRARYPSFSSGCPPQNLQSGGGTGARSWSVKNPGGSFQLSLFGSSASVSTTTTTVNSGGGPRNSSLRQ